MLPTFNCKDITLVIALFVTPLLAASHLERDAVDILDYVDPLIGTSNGGKDLQLSNGRIGRCFPLTKYRACFCRSESSIRYVYYEGPGAMRLTNNPTGMAKAVADCNGDKEGGYASDGSNITGFSSMHDSGTGGVSE